MPKVSFDSKFKRNSFFDYPKIKLEKNEKARVRIVDDPIAEYVHNLRKVVIHNGEPIMEQETYGRDGEKTRDVPKADFIGKFLCLGDSEVLDEQGVDPDSCPACKASIDNASAVEAPKRRVVVHVLKYATKKGSFEVAQPFQAQVLAWEMPETRFGKLIDIADEHGNIRQLDLVLGPCEKPAWQTYDIAVGNGSALAKEGNAEKAKEILKANMSPDLTPLLGRKVTEDELRGQINDILRMWDMAFKTTTSSAPAAAGGQSAQTGPSLDFSSLISGGSDDTSEESSKDTSETSAEAPDLTSLAQDAEEPKAEEKEEKKSSKTDEIPDLDSLLAGLN